MKWFSTTFVFGIFLFFVQTGIAASFSSQEHTVSTTESSVELAIETSTSCHHHTVENVNNKQMSCDSSKMSDSDCCMDNCHCNAIGCNTVSVVIATIITAKNISNPSGDVFLNYTSTIPQAQQKSLFRPPIYS